MSAGIDPGCVRLRIGCDDGRISRVDVASERPALAARLRGRTADEAVRLVPLLFALCGKAQGRAAALALEAARGAEREPHLDHEVRQEALREHLWRWLLDLPLLLGEPALRDEFVAAVAWVGKGQRDELGALLAGSRIETLQGRLAETDDVAFSPPRLLPLLDARASLDVWPHFDADFCRVPQWQGAAAETGAMARQPGRSGETKAVLASRWLARLDELRDWSADTQKVGAGGTASAAQSCAGRGRALVDTARGLLMHEIVLDGNRIADYFIVAPTEWNFHPHGPLAAWLVGRDATDRDVVQTFVARTVAALDPCVRWELEWS